MSKRPGEPLWWAVLGLVLVFQSAFFAWFPGLRSPNELTRVYLASALVEDGTVAIDAQIARHGSIFDVSVREVDGREIHYCDKAPGVSLLSVPVLYAYQAVSAAPSVASKVRLMRLVVSTLPTLLLLLLFRRFATRYLESQRTVALLALFYGLGSVSTVYATLAFGHQLSAVLLFTVFVLIAELPTSRAVTTRALGVGAAAGAAVMVEYQNSLLLLPFALYFLVRTHAAPRPLAAAVLGALPFAAVLLTYHQLAFGSPFATGYSFLASSFKEVHAQGLLGVSLPRWAHAHLSFLSSKKGLFFFAPWLALSVPGLALAMVRGPAQLRVLALFAMLYGLFVSALVYPEGGWTVSQRHLVPSVPFALVPIGLFVERLGRAGRTLLVGLGLPALVLCGLSACVWPHYPEELENPFWQLGWPLFQRGLVAPTPLVALLPSAVLATLLLGAAALLALSQLAREEGSWRARGAHALVACALAVGLLGWSRRAGKDRDMNDDLHFAQDMYRQVGR